MAGRKIDSIDRQLLALLQENNLQTSDELAERVGRSSSVIARRLRRNRTAGLVVSEGAQISPEAAGCLLSAVVHVQLERHARHETDQLVRELAASAHVQLCFEISGAFDLLLLVVAHDMAEFNRFADETLAKNAGVRRYETMFVKKRVKATLAFPIVP